MSKPPVDPETRGGTIRKQMARGARDRAPAVSGGARRVVLDLSYLFDAPNDPSPITHVDLAAIEPEALEASRRLLAGEGDCRDGDTVMLGWQDLPATTKDEHLEEIAGAARALADRIDAFVSLGIGGSYLGIEATFRALCHAHWNALSREERGGWPEIHFLGQNLDPDFFADTLDALRGKRVGLSVISKSGTTTETAIAFRIFRKLIEDALGERASEFIVVTTDASEKKSPLRRLAQSKGYRTFVVPGDVGGRFSVLTDVGLFGIAMAGIDLVELLGGAREMRERCLSTRFLENPALVHAAARTLAWRRGKKIEVVATNSQALLPVARWMEQLFPESEGKKGRGLFVATSMYSEKLHANGQLVQEGERNLIETFLQLDAYDSTIDIPRDPEDLDGLNFLSDQGYDLGRINDLVVDGPALAHYEGGVPNMTIHLPERSARALGQLYYLMERSVAVSGYLLGVNPFTQPGVQAYKDAMFALAGKPGYQEKGERIRARIAAIPRVRVE